MNDDMHEKLSVFMDDESDHSGDEIIEWLSRNDAARNTWWRYHIISDTLGGDIKTCPDIQLANRIAERIRTEPTLQIISSNNIARFLKPLTGLAIAATVATVAILGLRWDDDGQGVKTSTIRPPVAAVQRSVTTLKPTLAATTNALQYPVRENIRFANAQANNRMNAYLLNYYEYRSMSGGVQGVNPYMRIIANDPEKE